MKNRSWGWRDLVATRQVHAKSIVDAIADDIRQRLFEGRVTASEAFTEVSVSSAYEVARPTAKAAIEKLVSEGMLVRGPHKIARIPELDVEDIRDIYNTRLLLESQAVRQLASISTIPHAAVLANREIGDQAGGPATAIVEPDMKFHMSLVSSLGSKRVNRMYGSLVGEVKLCMGQVQSRGLLQTSSIQEDHSRILDLIGEGRSDEALERLRVHLSRARERLVGAWGGDPGPEASVLRHVQDH